MLRLQIAWNWRPLVEWDVGQCYAISPFFGSMHSLGPPKAGTAAHPMWLPVLGCTRRSETMLHWDAQCVIPPSVTHTWYGVDARHAEWSKQIERSLARRPLLFVIEQIERMSASRSKGSAQSPSTEDVLTELLASWHHKRNAECLPRALFRYAFLRRRGIAPTLSIGLHLPTDRMHAWIEVAGNVIGEEPDEMICYQGGVRYFSRTPHNER